MMNHKITINSNDFEKIKSGYKRMYLRLYDDLGKNIYKEDTITFVNEDTKEEIETEVLYLHIYGTFEYLYNDYDKISLGYYKEEECSYKDMLKIYSIEEQEKSGVMGIEIKLIEGE